jgi:hypothetical protein
MLDMAGVVLRTEVSMFGGVAGLRFVSQSEEAKSRSYPSSPHKPQVHDEANNATSV